MVIGESLSLYVCPQTFCQKQEEFFIETIGFFRQNRRMEFGGGNYAGFFFFVMNKEINETTKCTELTNHENIRLHDEKKRCYEGTHH